MGLNSAALADGFFTSQPPGKPTTELIYYIYYMYHEVTKLENSVKETVLLRMCVYVWRFVRGNVCVCMYTHV